MKRSVTITPGSLQGSVCVPLSKSFLHRALICSALAGDMNLVDIGDAPLSEDIAATFECLEKLLGDLDKPPLQNRDKTSAGSDSDMPKNSESSPLYLNCRESGSALRFLIPLAAVLGKDVVFTGGGLLPRRPLGEYKEMFSDKGIRLSFPSDGEYLPLFMSGRLTPGSFCVPGHISSQYITGLLLALPMLDGDSRIVLTSPLESESYVDITISVAEQFGVRIIKEQDGYFVPGKQRYIRKERYVSEPDFSQAAFWLVLSYLGHGVRMENLPSRSLQGDSAVEEILKQFSKARKAGCKEEIEIDLSQIPDLAPVLSVAAAATPCATRFVRAGRLRLKECDRLRACCEMLESFGIRTEEKQEQFTVYGKDISKDRPGFASCEINGRNDHRMVMAAVVAATCARGEVTITDPEATEKSYPAFFDDFMHVGGDVHGFDMGK